MAEETEAKLVPVENDGELTLAEFVMKARTAIDDMPESFFDCTGEDPEVPQTLDYWLEQLTNLMHNS